VRFNAGPHFSFPPPKAEPAAAAGSAATTATAAGGASPQLLPEQEDPTPPLFARPWRAISELEGDASCAVGAGIGIGGAQGLHSLSLISGLSVFSLDGLQSLLGGGAGAAAAVGEAAASSGSSSMALMHGTIVLPPGGAAGRGATKAALSVKKGGRR
jgi:hypothetical protein